MSVADVLRQAGFRPRVPNAPAHAGDAETVTPQRIAAVPIPKHGSKLGGHSEAIKSAYAALARTLAVHADCTRSVRTVDTGGDAGPVLVAVGIRGKGFVTLAIERSRYDGFELLRILDRVATMPVR